MKFTSMRVLLAATLLSVSTAVLAAPGNPIGGIIVKGGKNPGGQMLTLATTDARGGFTVRFAEGGTYRLAFDEDFGEQTKAGVRVDYVIKRSAEIAAERKGEAAGASRHTPFHNRLENGQMVVTIPKGGGEVRGVLQAVSTSDVSQAGRAINESGVGASPVKPKGGVRK